MQTDRQTSWSLTARWVFPVAGPPLERGIITIKGERIIAVEPHSIRTADLDLGNVAILPGLVNAHTHLDLSGLRGKCPPTEDFTNWLRAVIEHRRKLTATELISDIDQGIAECLRFGTTLVGDISGDGSSWKRLAHAPLRAIVFRELVGLTADRAAAARQHMNEWLSGIIPSPTCRPGVSPHAPYSVRAELIRDSISRNVPVAIHLAETTAELKLLADWCGPFVPFLKELGVWNPDGLATGPKHILQMTNAIVPVLFIHGNYLPPDAQVPAKGSIVYCPRTHAAFGHPPHPFREFLARGIRVALGTDSLASNPDLDVLAEARFVHEQYLDVPGAALLRMATLSGAESLGWQNETGSLEPGKSADLVILPLPDKASADPYRLVLESELPVQRVLFRGQWR